MARVIRARVERKVPWRDPSTSVTLAIALLPEEFPMGLASVLALGAGRLARRNRGLLEFRSRALAFVGLVTGNLSLALAESADPGTRFFEPHRLVFFLIAMAAASVALIVWVPTLASNFNMVSPPGPAVASAGGAGLLAGDGGARCA